MDFSNRPFLLAIWDIELYYYSTDNSSGEIDFVVQKGEYCIPVEVKASENLRAQSLRAYCRKYKPDLAIRTYVRLSGRNLDDRSINTDMLIME